MPTYLTPGVYVEEIPSGVRPIEGVATSIACFIGETEQGPVGVPTLIGSWDDFERTFGRLRKTNTAVVGSPSPMGDPMPHAVSAFCVNGGSKAYIVRLAKDADPATGTIAGLLDVEAANAGPWANDLVLRFRRRMEKGVAVFDASVGRFQLRGGVQEFAPIERLGAVVPESDQPNSMQPTFETASKLVRVTVLDAGALRTELDDDDNHDIVLADGTPGVAATKAEYEAAFAAMRKVRDINIVLLPGQVWQPGTPGKEIIEAAIAHCESMQNRMVIVDVPPHQELDDSKEVDDLDLTTSTYAVSYYPWPLVSNPYFSVDANEETGAGPAEPRTVLVSPASMAAGLWAKTDARRGVWKAPAGIEFALLGVNALEYTVSNTEQDFLNPAGVNALRRQPGFGPVVWGARTRSTRANPEWRYVPVRRTAIFIEESVSGAIQWAVFEPNDHRLWSSLRANIESFMNGLFRVGAFQGEKATDAYFVKCGLGQTMTQDDIDRGQVIVAIGFAPLKPAEFVIVRIQQKVGQQ